MATPSGVELFLGRLPPGVAERIFGFGFHLWMAKPQHYLGPAERHVPFMVGGDIAAAVAQLAHEIDHFPSMLDADVCRIEATMVSRDYARVVHLARRTAPMVGLRDIDPRARFPITDGDGAERWLTWRYAGLDAYLGRFQPKVPLHHLDAPPPPSGDGRRRQVEVYLRDPQCFLGRPFRAPDGENDSWVSSDDESDRESGSDRGYD